MTVIKSEAIKVTCMGSLNGSPYVKRLNPNRLNASIYPSKFPGRGRTRCPACSNDHFSDVLRRVLMTLISLLGPTGEQDCLVLSGSPERVSHKS